MKISKENVNKSTDLTPDQKEVMKKTNFADLEPRILLSREEFSTRKAQEMIAKGVNLEDAKLEANDYKEYEGKLRTDLELWLPQYAKELETRKKMRNETRTQRAL